MIARTAVLGAALAGLLAAAFASQAQAVNVRTAWYG